MEITGTVAANAIVSTTKNNKQVVNFSIEIQERYKSATGEMKTVREYFRCAYWLSSKVAEYLIRGRVITVSGRPFANAWIGNDGLPKAAMNFNASKISFLPSYKDKAEPAAAATGKEDSKAKADKTEDDDLPF